VNPTPPCPTCGGPLRWFPEHNAWGCDRERKMLPAAVPSQPQPMPMHAAGAAPMPRPAGPPGNKKKLILIGAIAAVVVGGGLTAFLLLKGGGPSGGAGSPEELAKRAAKAIADSDIDAYVALTGMDDLGSAISCHFADDNTTGDFREMAKIGAKRNMGIDIEVESVRPDDEEKVKTQKAGKYIFDSCKLTKDIETHQFKVRMKDGSEVERVTMRAMKVGDRWYFSNFDELPTSKKWDEDDDKDSLEIFKEISKKRNDKVRKAVCGSPESAAKGLFDAVKWRSRSRADAIVMGRYGDDFDKIFKCDGYSTELQMKIEKTDTQISELTRPDPEEGEDDDYGEGGRPRKRDEIELKSVKVTDKGKIGAGDSVHGCIADESMDRADLEAEVVLNGDDKETLRGVAIKVDDYWRILYFEDE
jgi:hypothetical protein